MKTNFRTLILPEEFYAKAEKTKFRKQCLQNQFDRSLLSIVLNLSEGNAKPTAKDRRKFFYTALGSLREVQALLRISDFQILLQDSDPLGAHLYRLCKSL